MKRGGLTEPKQATLRDQRLHTFLGGGFKYFLCSPLFGEDSHGLKPPTSFDGCLNSGEKGSQVREGTVVNIPLFTKSFKAPFRWCKISEPSTVAMDNPP